MIDYLELIEKILGNDNSKIVFYVGIYTIMCFTDFFMGSTLSFISKNDTFRTNVLKKGFMYKIFSIISVVVILPLVLMFDNFSIQYLNINDIGLKSYYFIVLVLTFAELKSIIGHINGSDGKTHDGFQVVINFMNALFKNIFNIFTGKNNE